MNFFQRPAEKSHQSIRVNEHDKDIANGTLKYVCEILEPDFLFFISRKAWRSYNNDIFHGTIGNSAHPTCAWWNRTNQADHGKTGKKSFQDFICDNKIFTETIT
jgi:hypothetical protein